MADDIEDLLRLQKGWKKPEPLPEPKFSVLFSQKRLFRDRAAQVLHEAHLGLASASDEIPPTQALADYLRVLETRFGLENCLHVSTFHGLSGSHIPREDIQRLITHLDFPGSFALFGQGGFWTRARAFNSEPSASPEPKADVSQISASPPEGFEAQ